MSSSSSSFDGHVLSDFSHTTTNSSSSEWLINWIDGFANWSLGGLTFLLMIFMISSYFIRRIRRRNRLGGGGLLLRDRQTRAVIEETVPRYLKAVYKAMYETRVGRKITQVECTNQILKRSTVVTGRRMELPSSKRSIAPFIRAYKVNTSEAELDVSQYRTFNDFFARRLKVGSRPIASVSDPTVLTCPADCRLLVFPSLSSSHHFWLKGEELTIGDLFGDNFQHLVNHFHDPTLVICRLAPSDYHRWHTPMRCRMDQRASLEGTYYSVSPSAVRRVNVFGKNKRELCLLHSCEFGPCVLVAVGASMVSSIKITAPSDRILEKGEEHGHFRFGGSTVLLLFQRGRVQFDNDLIANSLEPIETVCRMGERIGYAISPAIPNQNGHTCAACNIPATPFISQTTQIIAAVHEVDTLHDTSYYHQKSD